MNRSSGQEPDEQLAWMLKSRGKKNTLFPAGVPKNCSIGTSPCATHWPPGLSWQCQGNFSHVTSHCQLTPCPSPRSPGWTTSHLDSSQLPSPAEERTPPHLFILGVSTLLLLYPDFPHYPWNALFCHCYLENSLRVKTKTQAPPLLCGSRTQPCCTQEPVTFNEQAAEK